MALLQVSAVAADQDNSVGTQKECNIVVSVMDSVGNPVSGLAAANFKVTALIVAAGGSKVTLQSSAATGKFYVLRVAPSAPWKAGFYIFGVNVESGAHRGQALAAVGID
ncbi:MAG TPA: hypothetical protein VG148_14710 [Pyrinomonadaceae bacterium]|nr:hypothetical protein [Pyrinomonadaceae bacterium]